MTPLKVYTKLLLSTHLQNKLLCNIIESNFWVASKSSMNCDLKLNIKIGKKNPQILLLQSKSQKCATTPLLRSKQSSKMQNSVQFLLSSQGWIIGDFTDGRRLIVENEDIFPNSQINLVWATQTYEKSSFDSQFNYWVLVPQASQDGSEFEI